jgi:hypothetical protein
MSSVIAKTGATETVVTSPLTDSGGNILTGLTNVKVAIARASDQKLLDWSTNGFTAAPTQEYATLTEWDAVRFPGVYYINVNTSLFTGINAQDHYIAYIAQPTGTANAANLPQTGEIRIGAIVDKVEANLVAPIALLTGTASGGSLTTITLVGGSATTNLYKWLRVSITSGTGAGQARIIAAYNGGSGVATVDRPWKTAPDVSSVFALTAGPSPGVVDMGLAQGGASSTIQLAADASSTSSAYLYENISITGGTGAGQNRSIIAYNVGTTTATVDEAWTVTPDATSVYVIGPGRARVASAVAGALGSVWDEPHASHTTAGTFGLYLDAAVSGVSTSVWGYGLPGVFSAGTAGAIVGNYLDAFVSTRLAASAYTAPPSAATVASAVWNEATAGHTTTGTYGLIITTNLDTNVGSRLAASAYTAAPSAATIATAVWATVVPGSFSSGQAGYAIGTNLDTNVGSRLASGAYTAPLTAVQTAQAVWNAQASGYVGIGTLGALLGAMPASAAASVWATAVPGAFSPGQAGYALGNGTAPTAIADAVWAVDITEYHLFSQINMAGGALNALRMQAFNQVIETPGSPGVVQFYNDTGGVFCTVQIRDPNGNGVTAVSGEPAQRGAAY